MITSQLRKLFAIEEIEHSDTLRWCYYAIIAGFLISLPGWFSTYAGTLGSGDICPEYVRGCRGLMPPSPETSLLMPSLYVLVFGCLAYSVFSFVQRRYLRAQLALLPPFVFKFIMVFLLVGSFSVPFETFHLVPCFVFLFLSRKLSNLRVIFILLYVAAGLVKIHEGWLTGSFFESLIQGLPLVPKAVTPFATNTVIFMELVGVWFLAGSSRSLHRLVFGFFIFFHVYSVYLVGFRYPVHCLPLLIALFSNQDRRDLRLSRGGWATITFLAFVNLLPRMIPGDEKLSFEGQALAMNMFDANRQTLSQLEIYKGDQVQVTEVNSSLGWDRISPYKIWSDIQRICTTENPTRIAWSHRVSLNGSAFYQVVDEPNACALKFLSFRHNDWIHTDRATAVFPSLNRYVSTSNPRPTLQTSQVSMSAAHNALVKVERSLANFYLALASVALLVVVFRTRFFRLAFR